MQRRSIELAQHTLAKLYVIEDKGLWRYVKSTALTFRLFRREAPELIIVQNPSMILATLACIYGKFTNTPVIVDRHSTFLLSKKFVDKPWLKWSPNMLLFRVLSRFTLKAASMTIVTNQFLANLVTNAGGNPFILPDPIPRIGSKSENDLKNGFNVLFITSFADDEPIEEVLLAMRSLEREDITLHISGDFRKLDRRILESAPRNVRFTGFLTESEFHSLLWNVDAVMVLTTAEYTMLCGCYEAVAACKPLITSNRRVLKDYFLEAIFVNDQSEDIGIGIKEAFENADLYAKSAIESNTRISEEWNARFRVFERALAELEQR